MSDLTGLHNALCITRNLSTHSSTRETAILEILGGAGLRVSWMAQDGKGGKQRTSILPKPALEALQCHLNGRNDGLCLPGSR